jgi:hypothetical protein
VHFIARDGRGKSCEATVSACVSKTKGKKAPAACGDQGPLVDATQTLCDGLCAATCGVEMQAAKLGLCNEPVPRSVLARMTRAHKLISKGAGLVEPSKALRGMSGGVSMLQKAARAVFKAEREGKITPDCSRMLTDRLQAVKNAGEGVITQLQTS